MSMGKLMYDIPVIKPDLRKSDKPLIRGNNNSYALPENSNVRFIVKGGGSRCEFLLSNFELADVAKLRRIVMSSLEVMAIELVDVIENKTDLLDEIILQRLGLLPIRCTGVEDIPVILNTERVEDEPETGIPFVVNVENNTSRKKNVTEKDIEILDGRCKMVGKNTPIFALRPGQKFEIAGFIQKGTPKIHSKWASVGGVIYEYNEEDNEYVLKLQTNGQLTCREIVTQALRILEE